MDDGVVNDLEDYDFFIDDFRITSTSLGVEDNSISLFNYFPNPCTYPFTIFVAFTKFVSEPNLLNPFSLITSLILFITTKIAIRLNIYIKL